MKVGVVQMACVTGDLDANLAKAGTMLEEMAEQGVQFAVLPELFASGYRLDERFYDFAEQENGQTVSTLKEWAERFQMWLACTYIRPGVNKGEILNAGLFVSPQGELTTVDKKALWGLEADYFSRGQGLPIVEIEGIKVGMAICYELGFPEITRTLRRQGAEMIVAPSAFGAPRLYAWKLATCARALENGVFLVAANRLGSEQDSSFCGHSRIVSPQGEVLREVALEEGWIAADLDFKEVDLQQKRIPYLEELNCIVDLLK